MNIEIVKSLIRDIPDFPKPGILFKDIGPLLRYSSAMDFVCEALWSDFKLKQVDCIAGLDARGFIFGSQIAKAKELPFVMMRKKGKLPGKTISIPYDIEYGEAILEVQIDAFLKNQRVLIVDDLLATGGTAKAACELIEKSGAIVAGCAFVIELNSLNGRQKFGDYNISSLIQY